MARSATQEELFSIFPVTLFTAQGDTIPIHFILDLNTALENYEEFETMINHCGGAVSRRLQDATPHSVLVVDHNNVVAFMGPAFTMDFVKDCLNQLKKVDISKYRQEATSHIARNTNLWDVVYFRTETWDSVLTNEEKSWIRRKSCPDTTNDFEVLESDVSNSPAQNQRKKRKSSSEAVSENDELESDVQLNISTSPARSHRKKRKSSSDAVSDNDELESDIQLNISTSPARSHRSEPSEGGPGDEQSEQAEDDQDLSSDTDCETLYTQIQSKNSCLTRDRRQRELTQSGEEDSGKKNIMSKHNKDVLNRKLNGQNSKEAESAAKENVNVNQKAAGGSITGKKKWSFLDEFDKNSDSDSDSWPHPEVVQKVSVKYQDPKHSRAPYTLDEREKILKYIINHDEINNIKGRSVWVTMENRKICPFRTWQSMKEHFIKKIVPDLDCYDFITTDQRRKIRYLFK